MTSVRIVIPGKPAGKASVRGRVATAKDGRKFVAAHIESKTRNMMAFIRCLAVDAMGGNPPMDGPIHMDATLVFGVPVSWPKKKREKALSGEILPTVKPDISNWMKMIEDAFNEVVFVDDKDIVSSTQRKVYGEVAQQIVDISVMNGDRA